MSLLVRLNMEILKSAVLLANEHQSDQKKCNKRFLYKFTLFIHSRKNDYVSGMPENVASRRILTKMAASVSHRIYGNIKKNCRYKSPIYIYVYLPHDEADWKHPSFIEVSAFKNIVLFHIAVCFSTITWSELCKLDKELDNCNFTFI